MWGHTRRNQISSFARNGPVHLNRPGGGVSSVDCWQPRCAASAVVMLGTPCSEVVWRVLATHCFRQFPLHFPSRASPCAITFKLESTSLLIINGPVHLNLPLGVSSVDCWQPRCAASAVVMLGTPCSVVVWRVLATHCIHEFPLLFPHPPCHTVCHHISTGLYWPVIFQSCLCFCSPSDISVTLSQTVPTARPPCQSIVTTDLQQWTSDNTRVFASSSRNRSSARAESAFSNA